MSLGFDHFTGKPLNPCTTCGGVSINGKCLSWKCPSQVIPERDEIMGRDPDQDTGKGKDAEPVREGIVDPKNADPQDDSDVRGPAKW
jgi:hypothetical protein